MTDSKNPETIVLHTGYRSDETNGAVAVPIYRSLLRRKATTIMVVLSVLLRALFLASTVRGFMAVVAGVQGCK